MGVVIEFPPALIVPSPALILRLLVKRFPNKLVPKVSNNIPTNPPFCSFASFLIVSLILFIRKPDSSRLYYFHDIIHFFIRNY